MMDAQETLPAVAKRPPITSKALIHQKFGSKACYKTEEVQETVENMCPGLVIPQQVRSLYKCCLVLPELTVTSDTFAKKKDAEQAAAKLAIEKLGLQSKSSDLTPHEAWNELVARISGLFTDEFLLSSHPMVGHFRVALRRVGDLFGMIPISAFAACDVKINNLCKLIEPKAESDPLVVFSLILKAAGMSASVCAVNEELWIRKQDSCSPEALQSFITCSSGLMDSVRIEALCIPCSIEEPVRTLTLDISDNQYYIDAIAQKLDVKDASHVIVSRTVGKASSEMKLYFSTPQLPHLASDSSLDLPLFVEKIASLKPTTNKRASYLSSQNIYGDAILANVGFTWKSSDLFYEDTSLCTYYRMLLNKMPDGYYKLSREAILAAELPTTVTTRSNWKGPSPRDLLCMFCRQHRLSEPVFLIKNFDSSESSELSEACKRLKSSNLSGAVEARKESTTDRDSNKIKTYTCEVKIFSRRHDPIVESNFDNSYRKESDAVQNAALKVLTWLNNYFKQFDMPMEQLVSFGRAHKIIVNPSNFSREFGMFLSIYGARQSYYLRTCTSLGSICKSEPDMKQENGMILCNIEGPDSGVFPSSGSLTCINYAVTLIRKGQPLKEPLETNDEFEFEVGSGSVINQLEACVTQLSVNQAAQFIIELPSRDLILAAAGESTNSLSQIPLFDCFLEFSLKVLRVTEPLEDRMEQALFSPPLSKQRVEFAVAHINESRSTTLVDFGCGSGSLLDSLLEHSTTLEKIVGIDISCKSLTRAAKIIHSKLSSNSVMQSRIRSAVLYDGSITDFDSRLHDFDIGTCLEVIEHMEEDQARLFGDVVLSSFCPQVLIVSTPNYEYNPILQRSSLLNKDEDSEEKLAPCKFRNHDHKFEWTREQFEHWATDLSIRHNYSVEFSGVGGSGDAEPGFASQIAVFRSSPAHKVEEKASRNGEPSHPYEVIWEWTNSSRSAL